MWREWESELWARIGRCTAGLLDLPPEPKRCWAETEKPFFPEVDTGWR